MICNNMYKPVMTPKEKYRNSMLGAHMLITWPPAIMNAPATATARHPNRATSADISGPVVIYVSVWSWIKTCTYAHTFVLSHCRIHTVTAILIIHDYQNMWLHKLRLQQLLLKRLKVKIREAWIFVFCFMNIVHLLATGVNMCTRYSIVTLLFMT